MKLRLPLLITGMLFAAAAYPSDSMRCGNRLVSNGDPKAKVAELCGKPTTSERRTVLREGYPRRNYELDDPRVETATERELAVHARSYVEVEVEVWLYNRGRSSQMRELVFHDNRLIAVNLLGRGF